MTDIRLIYASTAHPDLNYHDLDAVLQTAREHNAAQEITGLLALCDRVFLQVLEGERRTLNRLYHNIVADRRHSGVVLLSYGAIEERYFRTWSMRLVRWLGEHTDERRALLMHHFGTVQLDPTVIRARHVLQFLQVLASHDEFADRGLDHDPAVSVYPLRDHTETVLG